MKITQGIMPANYGITDIIRKLNIRVLQPLSEYASRSILINMTVEGFSQTDPTTSKKGGSLGDLAISLVCDLTEDASTPSILLENPTLHAYGSVEADYLHLSNLAKTIDTIGQGEWDLRLKSMTIPLSDQVFVENRTVGVNSLAVSRIASKTIEWLRVLEQYPSFLAVD